MVRAETPAAIDAGRDGTTPSDAGAATPDAPEPAATTARAEAFEIAYRAVDRLPRDPFARDRSRGILRVVTTAVECGDLDAARRYADGLDDWRRASALAEIAFAMARTEGHDPDAVRSVIDEAEELLPITRDWQRDRVAVQVARAFALIGDATEADRLEAGVDEQSEQGRVAGARALVASRDDAERFLELIDAAELQGDFDVTRNTLLSSIELYERFYGAEDLRPRIEQRIFDGSAALPGGVRVPLLVRMVDVALGAGDAANANRLLDRVRVVVGEATWNAEFRVPLEGEIARRRALAGRADEARRILEDARRLYESQVHTIAQIFRSETLRPLAEAMVALGDLEAARAAYAEIVEIGADNPNGRPRAEDLSQTCLSMARMGFDPGPELSARIREILDGLEAPW